MPTKLATTWILVADGAKARILERSGRLGPLAPVPDNDFIEAQARQPTRDIGADRPGRVQESATTARHAMTPRVDWHRFAKQQFAGSVADMLEAAALAGKYESLILVAPPQALGDLRAALGNKTRILIEAEIGKDLTNLPDHELPAHLE